MITLANKNIEKKMSLSSVKFYNLIFESPIEFRKTITALKEQLDGDEEFFLAYTEKEDIKLSKYGYIIETPLNIQVDEKKTNLNIQKDIGTHIKSEEKEKFELLKQTINEYISEITYDYNLPVSMDDDINLTSFLKAMSLSYQDNSESFIERFINKIKLISFIFGYKIFFFINLHDYFSNDEMETIFLQLDLLEISYILISSHAPKQKISKEFLIIIDEDLCELHIE